MPLGKDIGSFIPEDSLSEDAKLKESKYITPTGDERETAWRFQEQCYLMLKWSEFVKRNRNKTGTKPYAYKNFCSIEHNNPFEYNNILFKKTDKANSLFQLNNAQLAFLVPQIRLFKEYIISPGQAATIELPFDDVLRKDRADRIMETSRGRGGGVGIKKFAWKTLGTNPAEKFMFGAQLVLHFQSIEDLFEPVAYRRVNMGGSTERVEVRYSDLILYNREFRKKQNKGSFVYDKDDFRIKAIVGWYPPKDVRGAKQLFSQEELDAIQDTRIFMYLGLQNHEIDFKKNGTVELTINYIAYAESAMSDDGDDILFPSAEIKKQENELAEKIHQLEQQLNIKTQENIEGTPEPEPHASQNTKKLEKEIEKQKERLQNISHISNKEAYQRIYDGLINKKRLYTEIVPTNFFNKQIRRRITPIDTFSVEEAAKQNEETAALNSKEGKREDNKETSVISGIISWGSAQWKRLFNSEEEVQLEEYNQAIEGNSEITEEEMNSEDYSLTYFYLGDLFEIVLEGMFEKTGDVNTNFLNKDIRVMLGNITFFDYGQLVDTGMVVKNYGIKNEKYGLDEIWTGKRVSVNIADIPISHKLFSSWFFQNISSAGLESMTFKDFVEKVINDLVIRAVSTECREFAPKQQARLRYKVFSVPRNKTREAIFKASLNEDKGFRINAEEIVAGNAQFSLRQNKMAIDNDNTAVDNYMFIYGGVEWPFDLSNNYSEDLRKGIYHIFFGNERGLVKEINFQREDLPFLRESNIYSQLADKKKKNVILRDKYNANVEMVGTNLFEVGSKIHITPTIPGTGIYAAREKDLKDLGIGGYYDIISVESVIESGRFNTTLEARWTARGDGTFNVGDKEYEQVKASDKKTQYNIPIRRRII